MIYIRILLPLLFSTFLIQGAYCQVSNFPTDTLTIKIDSIVSEIDNYELEEILVPDSVIQQLTYLPDTRESVGTSHDLVAYFKDTAILKIQFAGITYHFFNDELIRRDASCSELTAVNSQCNNSTPSHTYDYFDLNSHALYKSIRISSAFTSYDNCNCVRILGNNNYVALEFLKLFKLMLTEPKLH